MKLRQSHSSFAVQSDLVQVLACLERRPTPLVDEAFRQSLVQAEATIRQASETLRQAKIAHTHAARKRLGEGEIMVKAVRDFYQGLNRAASRDPDNGAWLEVFTFQDQKPKRGTLTSHWYEQARLISEANAKATAKLVADERAFSTPPPSNPSAEDVAATLPSAAAADLAWRDAIKVLKDSQRALQKAREQGSSLLTNLRLRLKVVGHGLSLQARHDLLRDYGFRLGAEQSDPEDANPPQAPNLAEGQADNPRNELTPIPA